MAEVFFCLNDKTKNNKYQVHCVFLCDEVSSTFEHVHGIKEQKFQSFLAMHISSFVVN